MLVTLAPLRSYLHESLTHRRHGCWLVPYRSPCWPKLTNAFTAGLGILRTLLADNGVSHVTYLGRRPLPAWVVLPGGAPTNDASPTHPKLSTIEHEDFLTYPPMLQDDDRGA
jgi:hypothetical protein